jgi:flagellar biosynthetic protein FliR
MAVPVETLQALLGGLLGAKLWPFFRIAGLVMVAPVLGARLVPLRVRIALSIALTIALAPLVPVSIGFEPSLAAGVVVAHEVVLGIAMGFCLQMIFDGLVIAGQTVAMSMGLGFAMLVDPQRGVSVPVLSQFFVILGILVFLSVGGHLAMVRMLAESFTLLPVGESLSTDSLWVLLLWGSEMFAGAVRIAIPAVTALLVVNLAFGVMSRAAPTLNLFAVGFPATLMLGFLALMLNIRAFPGVFSDLLETAFGTVATLLAR